MLGSNGDEAKERAGNVGAFGLQAGAEAVHVALDERSKPLGGAAVGHVRGSGTGLAVLVNELDAIDFAAGGPVDGCHRGVPPGDYRQVAGGLCSAVQPAELWAAVAVRRLAYMSAIDKAAKVRHEARIESPAGRPGKDAAGLRFVGDRPKDRSLARRQVGRRSAFQSSQEFAGQLRENRS